MIRQRIPDYPKCSAKLELIYCELARRYIQFHMGEDIYQIRLWGLAKWSHISGYLETGKLITDMEKENRTVWFWPRRDLIDSHIRPLINNFSLEELTNLAGW